MTTTTENTPPGVEQWLSKNLISESPFTNYVKKIYPLSNAAQNFINEKSYPSYYSKGDILVTAGDTCNSVYLIRKGVLRSFIKEGTRDITTWIAGEFELVTCISCYGLHQPARENIQALEDCELSVLSITDLQYLYEHFPETNIMGRKILEKYYRDAEERAFIARLMEATSKYKHFIATKSDLLNRVPLKFIASYLGMTLETLSRIRSKLSRAMNDVQLGGI